jgi:uncharacterized tellurite resistance protein B-like protein
MLDQIKRFFDGFANPDAQPDASDREHRLRLAVGALLLEMARMDGDTDAEEVAAVEHAVRGQLGLSAEESAELLRLAEAERTQATDYFQFTSLINSRYNIGEKIALVERLWRVAYADRALCRFEEHLVRKLAELLHIPHSQFIAARLRAAEAVERPSGA